MKRKTVLMHHHHEHDMRLEKKVAIVTGAGRGIRKDISLAYAREGAYVVVNDIDPATAGQTAADASADAPVMAAYHSHFRGRPPTT